MAALIAGALLLIGRAAQITEKRGRENGKRETD
jgi:hypothetical protein